MPTISSCAQGAADRPDGAGASVAAARCGRRGGPSTLSVLAAAAALLLAACAGTPPSAPRDQAAAAPLSPPREALPLDQAVAVFTDALFAQAQLPPPPGPGSRHILVIDPLIDRATGFRTATTRSMEETISARIRERHPQIELRPFTTANLAERPLVLLGAITGVAEAGSIPGVVGRAPGAYRIWAALADLRSGRVVSHPIAWVRTEDVDPAPLGASRDAPVWLADDPSTAAYLRVCAANPGDPIDPRYLAAIEVAALVADAGAAYEAGRYREALDFYEAAERLPTGDQLRVHNGIYLANAALRRSAAAESAFADVVDYGLRRDRLAVRFLFRPGSTAFWPDPAVSAPYPMWLRQIGRGASARGVCLTVTGHTSTTGPAMVNERLSLARAERVRTRVAAVDRALRARTAAIGAGSREPIVGNGADDASDLLDRRVEFRRSDCPPPTVTAGSPGPDERAAIPAVGAGG